MRIKKTRGTNRWSSPNGRYRPLGDDHLLVPLVFLFLVLAGCMTSKQLRNERRPAEDAPSAEAAAESETSEKPKTAGALAYDVDKLGTQQTEMKTSMDSIEQKLNQLLQTTQQQNTQLETLQQRLTKTEEQLGTLSSDVHVRSVSALLSRVRPMAQEKRYEEIVTLLKPAVPRVDPKDTGHDEVLYWFAKSLFETQQHEQAVVVAAEIETYHDKSQWLPKALLLQAEALTVLKKTEDAKVFYQALVDRFPKSSEAKTAKKQLKTK